MNKERIIQEFVPGKQVTLAHLIAHPGEELAKKDRRSRCWRDWHYDLNAGGNGDDRWRFSDEGCGCTHRFSRQI